MLDVNIVTDSIQLVHLQDTSYFHFGHFAEIENRMKKRQDSKLVVIGVEFKATCAIYPSFVWHMIHSTEKEKKGYYMDWSILIRKPK